MLPYLDLQSMCSLMLFKFNIESLLRTHFHTEKAVLSLFLPVFVDKKVFGSIKLLYRSGKNHYNVNFRPRPRGNISPSKINELSKNDEYWGHISWLHFKGIKVEKFQSSYFWLFGQYQTIQITVRSMVYSPAKKYI